MAIRFSIRFGGCPFQSIRFPIRLWRNPAGPIRFPIRFRRNPAGPIRFPILFRRNPAGPIRFPIRFRRNPARWIRFHDSGVGWGGGGIGVFTVYCATVRAKPAEEKTWGRSGESEAIWVNRCPCQNILTCVSVHCTIVSSVSKSY